MLDFSRKISREKSRDNIVKNCEIFAPKIAKIRKMLLTLIKRDRVFKYYIKGNLTVCSINTPLWKNSSWPNTLHLFQNKLLKHPSSKNSKILKTKKPSHLEKKAKQSFKTRRKLREKTAFIHRKLTSVTTRETIHIPAGKFFAAWFFEERFTVT